MSVADSAPYQLTLASLKRSPFASTIQRDSVRKGKAVRPVTPEAYAAYGAARLTPSALRRAARSGSL